MPDFAVQGAGSADREAEPHKSMTRCGQEGPLSGTGLLGSADSVKAKGREADIGAEHTILFSDIFARGYLFSDMRILFSDIMLDII